VRKDLHLKSKGYALNEVVTYLCKENIYYEAYFILDADNILDKDFIINMEKSYINGYDIATGFRNFKNGNDSIIAACSGITFSFLNSNGNEIKSRQSRNITLSGAGLFIVGDLIKKWQGFPFHSLTEDYEMTLYSIENNLTSYYNKEAMFYDEQPVKYKNTINQRIRWVKGYFDNRKRYIPKLRKKLKNNPNFGSVINEISGMRPYIIMIIGAIIYILSQIINIIYNYKFDNFITFISLAKILLIVGLAYALFALMTLFVIKKDIDKLNLKKNMQVKTILFSPLFFVTYVPCALKALFKKDVKWEKVDHIRRWNK
ncbi:MAG: glycosyltransferase, partial [Bacilli bacterium]|nr:glycosyltransferase [Bacilli bacterium]